MAGPGPRRRDAGVRPARQRVLLGRPVALSQGRFTDAQTRLEAALQAALEAREPDVETATLVALGRRAVLVDAPDAAGICDDAVAAASRIGNPILVADALLAQASACERAEEWERAGVLAGEAVALYREAGDPYGAATALAEQGWYDMVHGRLDASEQHLEEALELRRRHGDDRRLVEPLIDHAWLCSPATDDEAGTGSSTASAWPATSTTSSTSARRWPACPPRRPSAGGGTRRHASPAPPRRSTSASAHRRGSRSRRRRSERSPARAALGEEGSPRASGGTRALCRGRRRTSAERAGRAVSEALAGRRVSGMSAVGQRLLVSSCPETQGTPRGGLSMSPLHSLI